MKKILLLLPILLSTSLLVHSQDVIMGETSSVTQCEGNFYDSGGPSGIYNENSAVITFCPENESDVVELNFTQFLVGQSQDFLIIYDGDSTSAPQLGQFTGAVSPGLVSPSLSNESGCLTVEWLPDGTTSPLPGWAAEISCRAECQDVIATISSTAEVVGDNIYGACISDPIIDFQGSATFSNGIDENATYEWDFGNGQTANTIDATATYSAPGLYFVTLEVKDAENCPGNIVQAQVQIALDPEYNSSVSSEQICEEGSVTLFGDIEPQEYSQDVAPPVTGQTYLPDGSGISYETCISVDAFQDGDILENASDLFNIYVNIEHSYTGDLDISITAPNGNEVFLFTQAGGGNYFGEPIDNDLGNPGIGYDYFFSESANSTMANAFLGGGQSLPAGAYLPVESFSGLIGSELNGEWCLTITDNIGIDDGYVFEWGLNFDPAIVPPEAQFIPEIVSEYWEGFEGEGENITLDNLPPGVHCYTYIMEDNFGCDYSEEVCFTVYETPEVNNVEELDFQDCFSPGEDSITFDLTENNSSVLGDQDDSVFSISYYNDPNEAELGSSPINSDFTVTEEGTSILYVRIENVNNTNCYDVQSFEVSVAETTIATPPSIEECDEENDGET
ncbi:PKD domain-containing protein, partial [Mesonia sp.]|uniref:PKD domain-containing protein n=1 Tax=Mesonia sp. TaxID=1960830 RepID=UPI001761394F